MYSSIVETFRKATFKFEEVSKFEIIISYHGTIKSGEAFCDDYDSNDCNTGNASWP